MIKTILKCVVLISIFSACRKGDNQIDMQKDESIGLTVIDSFTVSSSTVLLDSIKTSGSGIILLGQLNDPDFGKIESSSYFPLQAEKSYPAFNEQAKFDSLKLSLEYDGYHYGDTTKIASLEVFQLSEEIKLLTNPKALDPDEKSLLSATSALYNNSKVSYENNSIGKIQFKTKPNSKDSVNLKLNSSFGENLFSLIFNKDPKISTNDEFNKYFKGLVLLPTGSEMNSLARYKVSSVKMRLYYSEPALSGVKVSKNLVFKIADSLKQFNRILADRSATALKDISYKNQEIPLNKTSNRGYVQAGTGLTTKIRFPYLYSFLKETSKIINKAELVIEVPSNPISYFSPPKSLNLLIADYKNKPQEVIQNSFQQGDQFALLQNKSDGLPNSARYIFNVTEYLNILRKKKSNTDIPLLLSVPISKLNKSLDRTLTGGPGDAKAIIKLNIFYTQFK